STEILQGLMIEELHLAHRSHGRDKPGNVVDDLAPREFPRMQSFLPPLAVVDVEIGSIPFHDLAGLVAKRINAEQMPAVGTVETTNPRFGFAWSFRSQDALPRSCQTGQIIRMDGDSPVPALRLFTGQTRELEVVPVQEVGRAINVRGPRERRNCVDDQLKVAFIGAQCIFCALPLIDIRQQHAPPDDLVIRAEQRKCSSLKPSIHTISTPQTLVALKGSTSRNRTCEQLPEIGQILRMD